MYNEGFNPRARRGRDLLRLWAVMRITGRFNPRARRGRDSIRGTRVIRPMCFNPRARRGRDMSEGCVSEAKRVSIHAPAGGATLPRASVICSHVQFQSTRPQGARLSF